MEHGKIVTLLEAVNTEHQEKPKSAFSDKDLTQDLCRLLGEDNLAKYGSLVRVCCPGARPTARSAHVRGVGAVRAGSRPWTLHVAPSRASCLRAH